MKNRCCGKRETDKRVNEMVRKKKQVWKPTVFISHPIGLRDIMAEEIIPKLEKHFKIENPFATKLKTMKGKTNEEIKSKILSDNLIVQYNLRMLEWCEGMILINPGSSTYGTTLEAGYCFFRGDGQSKIPVVFIVNERYVDHPWLTSLGTHVTSSMNEGINAMVSLLEDTDTEPYEDLFEEGFDERFGLKG